MYVGGRQDISGKAIELNELNECDFWILTLSLILRLSSFSSLASGLHILQMFLGVGSARMHERRPGNTTRSTRTPNNAINDHAVYVCDEAGWCAIQFSILSNWLFCTYKSN